MLKAARSWSLASFALLFASACGTTSRSQGNAGRPDRGEDSAQPPCPASKAGFRLRERLRGVAGCPSDIQTRPGPGQGFEVMFGCLDRGNSDAVVIVRGLGKKPFRQLLGTAPTEDDDGEQEAWRHFADNVRKSAVVQTIHRSSRIHACRSAGYAIELGIHSFREIDDAIRALGDWLARMDSSGEVMLVPEPRPAQGEPQ